MTDKKCKNIVVSYDLHARLKKLTIFESFKDGDFVSIGETIRRMCDFWEKNKNIRMS